MHMDWSRVCLHYVDNAYITSLQVYSRGSVLILFMENKIK